jgi:tetratricopeptide (TPR) repeat protein
VLVLMLLPAFPAPTAPTAPTATGPAQVDAADALWEAGRRQEAIELLEAALEAAPGDRELTLRLVRAELAVRRYASALARAEGLGVDARAERGRALFFLARYGEALTWLDPTRPDETLLVADALEALGRFEGPAGADAAVDRAAAALGPEHPQVLVLCARRHERHGRWNEAVVAYRAALAADPIERTALFRLGHALLGAGELEAGRAALERHRELMPLLDRLDDARRSVDLAPAHGPNHASVGDAERALGRIDQAEAAYRTALARSTGEQRVPVALRLARLLREDRASIDGAVALLAEVAEAPEAARDPRLSVRAGDYLMEAGRALEALQHYLRAEVRAPDDPSVRERVAKARRAAGLGS